MVGIVSAAAPSCARDQQTLGELHDTPSAGSPAELDAGPDAAEPCIETCSEDGRSVESCTAGTIACADGETCRNAECESACGLAEEAQESVGCEYYAVNTDILPELAGSCFVAFVTNTFATAAHLTLGFEGRELDIEKYARIPSGAGDQLAYEPYDELTGLPPGKVAVLFLSNSGNVRCPVPAARSTGTWVNGTGLGGAFRVTSDVPVVAMQMLPYGGGSAAITGASLLLPTSAWGKNYVAVNAWPMTAPPALPSLNVVAMEDDTEVTILPRVAIEGREGVVEASPAGTPITYTLAAGEFLQLSQEEELTGSPIESNKRIAVFGGTQCMYVPGELDWYCDHAEQQLPPVQAMSHEYAAASYRPRRKDETSFLYRLVGAVPGTELSYDPPIPDAPTTVEPGEAPILWSKRPFTVKSQDAQHPFMLFAYMTGGELHGGYGDPDFVRVVAPEQYLSRYVFFTDPTYPETSLVVIRSRLRRGSDFADVRLGCRGVLDGWEPIGDSGDYELTRVDLVRHDFEPQGGCDNGSQLMESAGPFGVTVWSWGGPETTQGSCGDGIEPPPSGTFTCHVSYAYPAGESVRSVNDVSIGTEPK